MKRIGVILLLFLASVSAFGQARNCGTDELLKLQKSEQQIRLDQLKFEEWLSKQTVKRARIGGLEELNEEVVYKVPVVVHIIHQGETLGSGTNIPDEQIFAQIQALNEDFRHLNADSVNTPSDFQSVMADTHIEFVLAKQNPLGFSTNGITRTNGGSTTWSMSENAELKSLSYWPSDDYLNIWVAPLSGDLLGWAEFPTSSIIPGVNEQAVNNPLTDGVVITTISCGSSIIYPEGNYSSNFGLGRTLTHEVGHFFGLRHIWGDGNCSVDDYVDDTPLTDDNYAGCPTPSQGFANSCNNELSMYMNYMDYVYDACMNLFSLGQKDRMHIVINNSPRRASLLTSVGLESPPALEAAILAITNPGNGTCTSAIDPEIIVLNNGVRPINQLTIAFKVNNIVVEEKEYNMTLLSNEEVTLNFSTYILASFGEYQLDFEILSTNGGNDDNPINNTLSQQISFSELVANLDETFLTWPDNWSVKSAAPISKWNFSKAPNISIENTSAKLNYYDNSSVHSDQLSTPFIDLTNQNSSSLLFDYAYAYRTGYNDALSVIISNDCGNSFTDTLFAKSGVELSSVRSEVNYSPSGPIEWRTVVLDLSQYANQTIKVAFEGSSAGGNNLYLDNFKLVDNSYKDVAIKGLANESGVYDLSLGEIDLIIENTGVNTIDNIEIKLFDGATLTETYSFNTLNLDPSSRTSLSLTHNLNSGNYNLTFEIAEIDGKVENNQYRSSINLLSAIESIPIRQNFDLENWNNLGLWTISSPIDTETWHYQDGFIGLKAFSFGNKGLHDWLVLPMLDFSKTDEAGLRFKLSYPDNNFNDEVLKIWVSTNKGKSYEHLIYNSTGIQLSTSQSITEFIPSTEDDWRTEFIDMTEFAGEENVLIGFEVTDGDGNNIYLDDIELLVSADEKAIELERGTMATYPNPVSSYDSKITFSLQEKQDIHVRIIDAVGNVISDQLLEDVLNQTYLLDLAGQRNGIYIVNAIGSSFSSSTRLMVNR